MRDEEIVCVKCGLVLEVESPSLLPEWRAFTTESRLQKSRVGPPSSILLPDKGLSTRLISASRDARGRIIKQEVRSSMYRLSRLETRLNFADRSKQKNLLKALLELDRMVDQLRIPKKIQEEAAHIYRQALSKGLLHGRSIRGIVSASLYAACRISSRARSLKDIESSSHVEPSELRRCYRILVRELNLHIPNQSPKDYITKIATRSNTPDTVQLEAMKLLERPEIREMRVGKSQSGIAAAVLYISCRNLNVPKTQKEVARAAQISEVTLRNNCRKIQKILNLKTLLEPKPMAIANFTN